MLRNIARRRSFDWHWKNFIDSPIPAIAPDDDDAAATDEIVEIDFEAVSNVMAE